MQNMVFHIPALLAGISFLLVVHPPVAYSALIEARGEKKSRTVDSRVKLRISRDKEDFVRAGDTAGRYALTSGVLEQNGAAEWGNALSSGF
ncbi:hypothetical protein MRX96_029454 [Rhipicephalus microplus]